MTHPSQWRRYALATALLACFDLCHAVCQAIPAEKAASLMAEAREAEGLGHLQEAMGLYSTAETQDPGNAQANLRIGLLFGRTGDFARAEAAFRRAIKSDPRLAEAHYNLGLAILAESKNPDWNSAQVEFRTALKLRPQYPEAADMVGVGLLETGQPALAVPQLRSALLLNPDSAEIHFNLGRALEQTGNDSEAYTEYLSAAQRRPAYAEAEKAIANILFFRKDYTSAITHLHQAFAADPDMESAHYLLGKVLRAQGNAAEAEIQFRLANAEEQRRSDAIRSTHLSNQSLELARQGDFSGAVAAAKQAVVLEPENGVAHYNLGLLLADSGELQAAVLEVRKAISLAPLQVSFYVNLAQMEQKLNRRAAAIDSLRRALLLDRSNPKITVQLKALEEKVPAEIASGLSSSPGSFPYGADGNTSADHYAFATRLANEGDLQGAIGELLQALSLEPARSDIRYNLAVAYTETGEYERAELELRKVLLVDAGSVEAHIALGTLLLQNKRLADAAAEFHSVLQIEPGNRQAPQLLSQCQAGAKP